ncbi:hypothetical protein [Streptomyces sp. NBC_01320]|uniref:hypothetical protein n=1 Tax=Streptomyces sp. NBC_01320 TaxID=2903824 RepID=UPI002E0F5692|nr:hypothetical protein OG395_41915 [Streptomyces sp. NBC_01320]
MRAAPALRGVIRLHSGRDGALLALLDSATPVGLLRQDLAVAWAAYRQAERIGIGTRIDHLRRTRRRRCVAMGDCGL